MKIAILGVTGMLGSAVYKYFKENTNYEIVGTTRGALPNESDFYHLDVLINNIPNSTFVELNSSNYIINCIGAIKPAFKNIGIEDAIRINSLFPHKISKIFDNKVINISTDCVYSGNKGDYIETDLHDALDDYGKTKSLGEDTINSMVLRTSIIGEEINHNYSLISWVKSQKDKEVNGFINHLWNGMTTTQYAKCCHKIIENNLYKTGLYHIFSDIHTKYEMLNMFNRKWNLNLTIKPINAPTECDRTLNTIKDLNDKLNIPMLAKQLEEI